jgi:hypothetical protein
MDAVRASSKNNADTIAAYNLGTPEADALVEEFREWLVAPAGDWSPNEQHLQSAVAIADAHYGAEPSNGTFGFDELVAGVLARRDPHLAVLNDEQLEELLDYGEKRGWEHMGPSDFKAWRQWNRTSRNSEGRLP